MRYPVNYVNITQGYHQGKCLDFGWSSTHGGKNVPIYACENGKVYSVENQPNGGNVIYLEHDNGICSCYAHLSKVLVKKGQKVKLGQQIGNMGGTGNVTGNHLHFGLFTSPIFRYKNSTLDPFKYLELYDEQEVKDKTMNKYGSKILIHKESKVKYVYNVDDEGLNVRKEPGGKETGKLLKTATKVEVLKSEGYWSQIGENEWVWSFNLSDKEPSYKKVFNVKNPPLNVRNKPSTEKGKIIGSLNNGDKVQVYETKDGWAKVSKDEERWVSANYLK